MKYILIKTSVAETTYHGYIKSIEDLHTAFPTAIIHIKDDSHEIVLQTVRVPLADLILNKDILLSEIIKIARDNRKEIVESIKED